MKKTQGIAQVWLNALLILVLCLAYLPAPILAETSEAGTAASATANVQTGEQLPPLVGPELPASRPAGIEQSQ